MAWFLINLMCCTSLQAPGGACLEVFCSEKKLSERLNLKSTQEKRSWPDSVMVSYRSFPSGMMSPLSDWITRKQKSISDSSLESEKTSQSPEDSPVRTSLLQVKVQELKGLVRDFGERCAESLLRFDPDTSSWRTLQCSLFEDLSESLPILPKYGIALRGQLWELPTLEQIIREIGFGALELRRNISTGKEIHIPTPTVTDASGSFGGGRSCETEDNFRGVSLARLVEQEPHKMWPEKMNGGGYNLSDTCGIRSQTRLSEQEQRQEGDTEESDNGCDREKFPTPTTRDYKGSNSKEHIERGNHIRQLANYVKYGIEGGYDTQLREQETEEELRPDLSERTEKTDLTNCPTLSSSRSRKRWRTPVCSDANMNGIQKGFQLHLAEQVKGMETDE